MDMRPGPFPPAPPESELRLAGEGFANPAGPGMVGGLGAAEAKPPWGAFGEKLELESRGWSFPPPLLTLELRPRLIEKSAWAPSRSFGFRPTELGRPLELGVGPCPDPPAPDEAAAACSRLRAAYDPRLLTRGC